MKAAKLGVAVVVLMSAVLTGCASVPMASKEQDMAAKTYQAKADKASLYVYRNENLGAAVKLSLLLDNKLIGDTAAKTYYFLQVEPGKHTLLSKAENDSILDITAEAGKNYFVWQEVKMGMFQPRSQLRLMSEAEGKAGVAECQLAAAQK